MERFFGRRGVGDTCRPRLARRWQTRNRPFHARVRRRCDFMFSPSTPRTPPIMNPMSTLCRTTAPTIRNTCTGSHGGGHGRGVDRADIGTTFTAPNIYFATLARGMGVDGEGLIVDPKDLTGAPPSRCCCQTRRTGGGDVVTIRAEETAMKYFKCFAVAALATAAFNLGASSCCKPKTLRQAMLGTVSASTRRRGLHLSRPFRARRGLRLSGAKFCQN